MARFRIPTMYIQDKLMELESNPKFKALTHWLNQMMYSEQGDWGIKGKGYEVDFALERQWYPVFILNNQWIADALIQKIAEETSITKRKSS